MVGKAACQTEIPLQAAPAPLLFCIADFTWAPCQDTVYIVNREVFKPKALKDTLIPDYHSLASDDLTFRCCFACPFPLSLLLFFFPC